MIRACWVYRVGVKFVKQWRVESDFLKAIPEIPVNNVENAAPYYANALGFDFDWEQGDSLISSRGDHV